MKITDKIVEKHGLKQEEYRSIIKLLKREPNFLELGIFSAMWNEHCSYKSSKVHLKKLPIKNKNVIQGPGENAGVIDIGDDDAIVFKIESHNHPSFIEPYQGAATGVGGILRDVFTMGARPIALLNSIHFGDPKNKKTKNLLNGVVSGIGGYGNCIGIPTVAGETKFNSTYNENILVNAMAVGLANKKKIFYSKAKGINKPVVYVGSKTGRDGIHGASMASAEFDENTEEKKPTVQVGDPFTEKLLMEACLELMKKDSIISIQDMGAAGLTSSSVEMAHKGNLGIELDLDKVPCREENMSPYEMMLSESQERMLIILEDGKENEAKKIFNKWDLDFVVIGKTTDTKNLSLKYKNKTVATIPIEALSSKAPLYDRKWTKKKLDKKKINLKDLKKIKFDDAFFKIISSPNHSNKKWVTEQFDQMVMGDTIERSGTNAAVVKIHGKEKAIAVTVDSSANYCKSHPLSGGKQIVCESWRNLVAVGAKPIAITNCLNFGNPENPEIMGQFAENILGIKEACEFLDYPVVSGNVSFYNQTKDQGIKPTPSIGGVGLIKDYSKMITMDFKEVNNIVLVIGKTEGHIDQSLFARVILDEKNGPPPEINLFNEKNNGETLLKLIDGNLIKSAHDVSLGGIITAVSKMCIKSNKGINLKKPKYLINEIEYFFAEDQGRYIIEISKKDQKKVEDMLNKNAVHFDELGTINENVLFLSEKTKVTIDELKSSNTSWLIEYMSN